MGPDLMAILAIIAAMLIGYIFFGITGFWLLLVFAIGVVAALGALGYIEVFGLTQKFLGVTAIICIGFVGLSLGWIAMLISSLPGMVTAAEISPGATAVIIPPAPGTTMTEGECKALVENPDLVGKAATVTMNAYDMEADAKKSGSAIDVPIYIYRNGQFLSKELETSGDTMTALKVGQVLSARGGNATYYVDPVIDFCITGEQEVMELEAHTVVSETDLVITCYDETGSTALNAAGNTSTGDYNLTLGASGEKQVWCKIENNVANKASLLAAIGTATSNDVKHMIPLSGGFTRDITPSFLDVIDINSDVAGSTNISHVSYRLYNLDEPLMLHNWDWVKYQYSVKAGGTDPSYPAGGNFGDGDNAILCHFDGVYERGADGDVTFGAYLKVPDAETNVGMVETMYTPVGKDSCVVINAI